jgi:NADH-quinone oxidoreductase subunit G
MPVATQFTAAPAGWFHALGEVAAAIAQAKGIDAPVAVPGAEAGAEAQAVAASLLGGERKAVLLGNSAAQHPQAGALLALASWIAEHTGASVGYLGEAANSVGAQLVGALPGAGGLNAGQMLGQPMKALLLLATEPLLDAADPATARMALAASGLVVAMTPFKDAAIEHADVLLPVTPFTETAGSFVNTEGRLQSFHGVVKPLGEARPAWKVLRVLGNLLGLDGFGQDSADDVLTDALGDPAALPSRLDNRCPPLPAEAPVAPPGLQRIADVPIYATDMLVRRAPSLQLTADARPPVVGLPSALWRQLRLQPGAKVLVGQGEAVVVLPAREEPTLAEGTVRIAAGHPTTAALGAMFGTVTVEHFVETLEPGRAPRV